MNMLTLSSDLVLCPEYTCFDYEISCVSECSNDISNWVHTTYNLDVR